MKLKFFSQDKKKPLVQTINMNKTTITQLVNTKIYNLQNKLENFKIIKNKELLKILGIYFSKDLQFANVYN